MTSGRQQPDIADLPFYDPSTYDLRRSLGFLLRENGRMAVNLAEDNFETSGLTFSQWLSLFLLDRGLVATIGDLTRALRFTSGATTRLVDQLERQGLVQRERSTVDRRVMSIALTETGHRTAQRLLPRLLAMWNDILAEFGHEDARTLIGLLVRLSALLHTRQRAGADDDAILPD